MKRGSVAVSASLALVLTLLGATPGAPADAEEETKEPPRYESPVVSLLFLPVTILLKIAEVVSPDARSSSSDESEDSTPR